MLGIKVQIILATVEVGNFMIKAVTSTTEHLQVLLIV